MSYARFMARDWDVAFSCTNNTNNRSVFNSGCVNGVVVARYMVVMALIGWLLILNNGYYNLARAMQYVAVLESVGSLGQTNRFSTTTTPPPLEVINSRMSWSTRMPFNYCFNIKLLQTHAWYNIGAYYMMDWYLIPMKWSRVWKRK